MVIYAFEVKSTDSFWIRIRGKKDGLFNLYKCLFFYHIDYYY